MSAVNIPEVKNLLKSEQVTVQNLLIENGQLIETVAEYQRMGKILEATKYQERLHANLIYLAKLADSTFCSHLLQEVAVPSPTQQPPAELPLTTANSAVASVPVTLANAGAPCQQHPPGAMPVSHTSPPNSSHPPQQLHAGATTPPAHLVQYQFPSPTHSSPHIQTVQHQHLSAQHYSQQTTVPFQRNLNVPPHPMLFPNQQHVQQAQQQQQQTPAQQHHSIVYATGHTMQTQHHQQYSAYPLLQQQSTQQFQPSVQQPQFPSVVHPTGGAYTPVAISTQSDSIAMGIRQHQQTYQNSYGSHSVVQQHGTPPGGYLPQQK